jgi:hypothetical protein
MMGRSIPASANRSRDFPQKHRRRSKVKTNRIFWVGSALAAALAANASADTLAGWTFETSIPATAGPFAAENGVNAATSFASGFHALGGVVYSNPVGNGSNESYSSNFWSTGDYYQFTTSTLGFNQIKITWNQTSSSTGPATFDLEYSTDGTTFFTLLNDYAVQPNAAPNPVWTSGTFQPLYVLGPVNGPAALDNLANVTFRLTSQVTSATAGTDRVDNVVIEGTVIPEPASLVLLILGGLTTLRRR